MTSLPSTRCGTRWIRQSRACRLLALSFLMFGLVSAAPYASNAGSAPHLSVQSGKAPFSGADRQRADYCIDRWNENHNFQDLTYEIMGYSNGSLGPWRLYCGKTTGTATDPARGLLHINMGHKVQPNTAHFVDCLFATIGNGVPFATTNPAYVGRRYTHGTTITDAVLWDRGGYYTVITAYTRGSVSNNWVGCA